MKIGTMWVLLALTACGDTEPADNPNYPPGDLDAALTACSEPTDCVVVELGCCDQCNGGTAVSVNTASADQVREDFSESCEEGTACTELGCAPWVTTCDSGTCGAERDDLE